MTQKAPPHEPLAHISLEQSIHDQAVRLMASWIASIADQVKNPVAGISAAAELIEREMASFRDAGHWDPGIVEEAVRLMVKRLGLFNNYLTELAAFTRPANLRMAWHDMHQEWTAIELHVSRHIPSDYQLSVSLDQPSRVFADLDCLKTILAAIVLNAVEACGSSISPEVNMTTRTVNDALTRSGVLIQVSDNGPGFSEEAAARAFVPFFTTKEAGTGLGLALVDKYVRAHNGWIRVDTSTAAGGFIELFFPHPNKLEDS